PGGELEGKRPKALCSACREQVRRAAEGGAAIHPRRSLCFQCYRAELERERALEAAGQLDTATEARFRVALPFESVNVARLALLKAERASARADLRLGPSAYVARRRQAQIRARHALQSIAAG